MINRVNQQLDTAVPVAIAELQREALASKRKQRIGGDSIITGQTGEGTFTTTIASGTSQGFIINLYASLKVLYQSEIKPTFFINTDANGNFAWPYGTSTTPADLTLSGPFCDLAYSDELGLGNKSYMVVVKNNTVSSITLYIHFTVLFPQQTFALA